jgi:hypothetical protein
MCNYYGALNFNLAHLKGNAFIGLLAAMLITYKDPQHTLSTHSERQRNGYQDIQPLFDLHW